jgi:hypothetical protein
VTWQVVNPVIYPGKKLKNSRKLPNLPPNRPPLPSRSGSQKAAAADRPPCQPAQRAGSLPSNHRSNRDGVSESGVLVKNPLVRPAPGTDRPPAEGGPPAPVDLSRMRSPRLAARPDRNAVDLPRAKLPKMTVRPTGQTEEDPRRTLSVPVPTRAGRVRALIGRLPNQSADRPRPLTVRLNSRLKTLMKAAPLSGRENPPEGLAPNGNLSAARRLPNGENPIKAALYRLPNDRPLPLVRVGRLLRPDQVKTRRQIRPRRVEITGPEIAQAGRAAVGQAGQVGAVSFYGFIQPKY